MADDDDFKFADYTDRISASREPDVEAIDPDGDVAHLTQAWVDERAAPELLQYQEQCIRRLLAKIEEQVSQAPFLSKLQSRGVPLSCCVCIEDNYTNTTLTDCTPLFRPWSLKNWILGTTHRWFFPFYTRPSSNVSSLSSGAISGQGYPRYSLWTCFCRTYWTLGFYTFNRKSFLCFFF